eukprot:CAMPEP_0113491142 /NCGR_PEP_ID=MMETSP0014_2-20120614/27405_1 /TAXON_ID=2857 /ORGANISM="Nitzschia sp." /LENGTH=70 /DNA_ID=CAMNT_0000384927 /DNA_START=629 /DNA_END=841 /DNA_ORIENTATION=- /assembly_acc=CAM_ASM_000159
MSIVLLMVQYTTIVGAACNDVVDVDVVVVWIDGGCGANADTDDESKTSNATTAVRKRSTVEESFVMVKYL